MKKHVILYDNGNTFHSQTVLMGGSWATIKWIEPSWTGDLEERREMFRLWGEDELHPFFYKKMLDKLDEKIERLQNKRAEIWDDYEWEISLWHDFGQNPDDWYPSEEPAESFKATFNDLCRIDGVNPVETFDRVYTAKCK